MGCSEHLFLQVPTPIHTQIRTGPCSEARAHMADPQVGPGRARGASWQDPTSPAMLQEPPRDAGGRRQLFHLRRPPPTLPIPYGAAKGLWALSWGWGLLQDPHHHHHTHTQLHFHPLSRKQCCSPHPRVEQGTSSSQNKAETWKHLQGKDEHTGKGSPHFRGFAPQT